MSTPEQPTFRVPAEMLARYDVSGPRYTSYPTAPEWKDGFGEAEGRAIALTNGIRHGNRPLSLYVHLPFCQKLCYFCGCNMLVTRDEELVERYLKAVEWEIEQLASVLDVGRRPVMQIHWGGGTPTYLNSAQLRRLFEALTRRFKLADGAEISLEVHPAVTTFEQLATLRELGFNRLSLGIQDFDAEVQAAVNRPQTFEVTRDLILEARRLGFESINVDLMYGLPKQTLVGFEDTLAKVRELAPDRIALFNYAYVPWLKKHMSLIQEADLPAPELKVALFERAVDDFTSQGMTWIGMDHFARPDNELARAHADRTLRRNFMGYTTCRDTDLVAFGVSSISDWDEAYTQNDRDLMGYLEAVEAGTWPVKRGLKLSSEDKLRRDVINRLICHGVVEKEAIEAEHWIPFDEHFAGALEQLAPLAEDGLVLLEEGHIRVTPRGQVLLRNVCMAFDTYLDRQDSDAPRFSRTV
jgi:oxygen-independent coproporphyrinogen-3 oxidase